MSRRPCRTDEKLKENEQRLSWIQAIAHVGDWEWDLATNLVHWSDELYRIYGYDPHEIVPDYDLVLRQMHPESKEKFLQAIDAALNENQPFEMDYIFYRKDGSEAVLHTIGRVLRDESGEPFRMAGIVQDITEQKRVGNLLRLSEDKLRTIFEKANDGILIADAESRKFVEANRTICDKLGYNRDELCKMGVADIHPEKDLAAVGELFDRLAGGEISVADSVPVQRRDGTLFFADIGATLIDMEGKACLVGIFHDITERLQVEEELKVQGKRFAESQRIAHIGSFEHNLKTNDVYWSDELFRLLGLDPEKDGADFDMFFSMVHPDDQPILERSIAETLHSGNPFHIDYRFLLKDGSCRILRAIAELIPDSSGKPVILSGTAQDVTRHTLAEQRLSEKNIMLQTLLDAIPDQVIFKDAGGRYLLVNRAMEKSMGMGKETFVGMTDEELSPPPVAEMCKQSDAEAIKKGAPTYFEEGYVDKNGEKRFLDVVKSPIKDSHGDLQGLVVVSRDITERKKTEEQIQKSEWYIRNILNTVDEGFIVVDRNYRIQAANRAYCYQMGLPEDRVVGKCCYEVSHKLSRPCHEMGEECCVKEVFARGESHIAYHRHEDADGNLIYVETKGFPLTDASGTVTQAIETISDITEKRLLEAERLKVQKLEAIGTLAGGIAHDFNNLLQGVFGYISMARLAAGNNQETVTALENAEKALQLTVRMTNQLLTFSKGGKPVKKTVDIRSVIENAVRFSLSGSSVSCRTAGMENPCRVEADEGQLTQVVQNIILNAIQAMPQGGAIEVSMRNIRESETDELKDAQYVEVAIRDNGTGIPEEIQERIFDPYFTTKEEGNGLGLATSYSIIKNHGGWIKVDSETGEGTTFFIYLPVSGSVAVQPPRQKIIADQTSRTGKILIMDDEPMICQIAGALISMLGHKVDFAKDGEEALAKYGSALQDGEPFDAAILDLTIRGGLGGIETIRELRELDPGVKAAVSSGYADSDVIADFRNYGFIAFLNKPYDVEGLRSVLHVLLHPERPETV